MPEAIKLEFDRNDEAKLIVKAWVDETFKQELLVNPKAVYERELGIKISENLKIEVVEETYHRLNC